MASTLTPYAIMKKKQDEEQQKQVQANKPTTNLSILKKHRDQLNTPNVPHPADPHLEESEDEDDSPQDDLSGLDVIACFCDEAERVLEKDKVDE